MFFVKKYKTIPLIYGRRFYRILTCVFLKSELGLGFLLPWGLL